MPSRQPRQCNLTLAPVEALEARIVMSAQPLADFVLDYVVEDAAVEQIPRASELGPLAQVGPFNQLQPTSTDGLGEASLDSVRNTYGFTGSGQTVAVIDTGIAYDHNALGGGFGESYRVVGGWDFAENDADPYDDGGAGAHGTHVAGIIGSNDPNNLGVAPGVDIVALRVFDDVGAGYFEWVEDALQWVYDNRDAFDNPITAVNLSLGAAWNSDVVPNWATLENEFAQLESVGIFIGVAAGNSFTRYQEVGLGYPAVSPYVVPVSSVDADGSLSYFSQRSDLVIAAPGRNIVSTVPDYAGDQNGIADDFASFSGTSMATPYVVGASALLRQAFALAGQTNVTQDQIYDVMRATADSVWDNATEQFYSRINVGAAIDAIIPDDDYGSTTAAAAALGTVGADGTTVSGIIERLDDVDYFRFTASATGEASFTLTSDGDGRPVWMSDSAVSGRSVSASNELTFQVVAGEEYVVAVGAGTLVSRYDVQIEIQATAVDLGTIDFARLDNIRFDGGDAWYSFTASRDGLLTVQALFGHAAGDINLELYDASGNRAGASTSTNSNERIDINAVAGESYMLRVVGGNDAVDLRVTNLVERVGSTVTVYGTDSNDQLIFRGQERLVVSINGVQYRFDASDVSTVRFDGGEGSDRAVLIGSAADDVATLYVGAGTLQSDDYQIDVTSVENIRVHSGGGQDVASFFDSAGSDRFVGRPEYSYLHGTGFLNFARGFSDVRAQATAGGVADRATLYDSAGNDLFLAFPDRASIEGTGFFIAAAGFDQVGGYATAGGTDDRAQLYDSAGNDVYVGRPNRSALRGNGFNNFGVGFDRVFAYSNEGGSDRAFFHASSPTDSFESNSEYSVMTSPTSAFYNYARGFARHDVVAADLVFSQLGDQD